MSVVISHDPVEAAVNSGWIFEWCPQAPHWTVDWERLSRFSFAQAMSQCTQDATYHAEGDVWTHTRMVCDALIQLDQWRAMSASHRSIIFLAALLHDVGKPFCTHVAETGRISSAEHGKVGAKLARQLLWLDVESMASNDDPWSRSSRAESSGGNHGKLTAAPVPLFVRELVSHMVRASGLPFWLSEREDPLWSVIRASQTVRCDWLALLARADAGGRLCADQSQLYSRVSLFEDYCQEHNCFDQPFAFPTEHSRFSYFQRRHADPSREIYDATRNEVVMLCGLPGSGKDEWLKKNGSDYELISLDDIRLELGIEPDDAQDVVVGTARERARQMLRTQTPFVWNATNTTRFMRNRLISFFASHEARVNIVYIEPSSFKVLSERNASRARVVPLPVLQRLARNLEPPDVTEAQEVLWHST